ncbi:MAG: helix-turn-helix domain-containing protein [Bacillota bacterium]|jgi:purine catabolism regulator|nr:helix-turn-helix domain-containing protein [Bacillota bacterium]
METLLTVRDAIQLLQNYGVKLENDNEGLSNPIRSITFFIDENPDPSLLMGSELVIIPHGQIDLGNDNKVIAFIEESANYGISALLFYYDVGTNLNLSSTAFKLSNELKMPIISVDKSVAYSTIALEIYSAIFNHDFDWSNYSRLIEEFSSIMLLSEASFDMIVATLAKITQQDVIVLDRYGFVMCNYFVSENHFLLRNPEILTLFSEMTTILFNDSAEKLVYKKITIDYKCYLCTLCRTKFFNFLYYFVLISDSFDTNINAQFIKTALFQASRSLALVELKSIDNSRIKEAELSDFYGTLFSNATISENQLIIKAANCGIEINAQHQAIIIELVACEGYGKLFLKNSNYSNIKGTLTRMIELSLSDCYKTVFVMAIEDGFAVFAQLYNHLLEDQNRELLNKTLDSLRKTLKSWQHISEIYIGVGMKQDSLIMLRDSLSQANEAIKLGQKISFPGNIYYYGELGIYSLLSASTMGQIKQICYNELTKFNQLLGSDADSILETLETFLDTNCSYKDTAIVMNIHTNTVRYRISKVREILNILTDDCTDELLRVHIILKMRHLL